MRTALALGAAALALAIAGCAHEQTDYRPRGAQQARDQGPPAAIYPLPAGAPRGTVYVASLGGERLGAAAGQPEYFLHLRVAAENTSDDTPWTIDANDQVLTLAGGAAARPTYAVSSKGGSALTLARGERGQLDVYYPLPGAGDPPKAFLAWTVRRGGEAVAQTTEFDRVAGRDPEYAYAYDYRPAYRSSVVVGFGPSWWWGGWGPYGWSYWDSPWGWHHPGFYYHRPYRPYYGGYGGGPRYYGGGGGGGGSFVAPPASSRGSWRGGGGSSGGGSFGGSPPAGGSSGGSRRGWRR
jgi:hypothetical protein